MVNNNNEKLFFILGPCAMESEIHTLKTADFLKNLSTKLNFKFIFKASYDKANRTSLDGYRSLGMKEGLKVLAKVKEEFNLPVITDIHESWQAQEVAPIVDVIQIPAFLCRQTDLLIAAGNTNKIVNIKKGQFLAPDGMAKAAQKVASTGNNKIWLCERGYTFGYNALVVDFRSFPIMKSTGYPVVFDATHSVQKPGGLGGSSGGERQFVADLAISAVAQGIAGVFMEVHENPEKALSDGPNSVRLSQLEDLLKYLLELDSWVKSRNKPVIF